jgi:hypothetical protein
MTAMTAAKNATEMIGNCPCNISGLPPQLPKSSEIISGAESIKG